MCTTDNKIFISFKFWIFNYFNANMPLERQDKIKKPLYIKKVGGCGFDIRTAVKKYPEFL